MKTTFILPDHLHTEFKVAAIRMKPRMDKSKLFELLVESFLLEELRWGASLSNLGSLEIQGDRRRPQTFYISDQLHTEFYVVAERKKFSKSRLAELLISRFLQGESSIINPSTTGDVRIPASQNKEKESRA